MAKRAQSAARKPRTDAQRNRERILEVAKEAFTRSGANASLDDIAKQSGVGAGTLYRHFPTRDALLEAVYRTEVEKIAAAERELSEKLPPVEALRAWMLLFVDYIAAKQIIAPALNAYVGGPSKLYESSRAQVQGAIHSLVKRSREWRHTSRPRSLRSTSGSCRRLQRGLQPRLEAKRQETRGYPHHRFPAKQLRMVVLNLDLAAGSSGKAEDSFQAEENVPSDVRAQGADNPERRVGCNFLVHTAPAPNKAIASTIPAMIAEC
jgi:AcrR family transcriptional regulator